MSGESGIATAIYLGKNDWEEDGRNVSGPSHILPLIEVHDH
jgi:hypothetical protein